MFNLLPKDPAFYDRLQQFSARLVQSARNLMVVVDSWPNFDGTVDAMERDRHMAHRLLREILLNWTQPLSLRSIARTSCR